MSNLTPELQKQIEQEAKDEAKKLNGRVPIFRMGYEAGHYDGAESYALKQQEAEQRSEIAELKLESKRNVIVALQRQIGIDGDKIERYEKALQRIEQFSDPGDYWKAICDMKAIASDALTPKTDNNG